MTWFDGISGLKLPSTGDDASYSDVRLTLVFELRMPAIKPSWLFAVSCLKYDSPVERRAMQQISFIEINPTGAELKNFPFVHRLSAFADV